MLSRSYTNWTATELRAFARKNGLKASLPKDELWELCYPVIVEQINAHAAKVAQAAREAKQVEDERLAAAAADYEARSEMYIRIVTKLNTKIDDHRAAINEWIESLRTTSSLSYALRNPTRVLNDEFHIYAYSLCVRILSREDIALDEKISLLEDARTFVVNSLIDGHTDDAAKLRVQAQVYGKVLESIKAY